MEVREIFKLWDEKEIRIILRDLFDLGPSDYILNPNLTLDDDKTKKVLDIIEKRKASYPLQYILGKWYFYDLELFVEEGVLIPRPETEILVDLALERAGNSKDILDIGTGTGAIAIALAKHLNEANITAVDISDQALNLARKNAEKYDIKNLEIIKSDLFSALEGRKFDMIVSNPPYVGLDEKVDLAKELDYEPDLALFSGRDGLDLIKNLVKESVNYLNENGIIIIEMGYKQASSLENLLRDNSFRDIKIIKDYAERDRFALGRLSK